MRSMVEGAPCVADAILSRESNMSHQRPYRHAFGVPLTDLSERQVHRTQPTG